MSLSHELFYRWKSGGRLLEKTVTQTSSGQQSIEESIPDSTSDKEVDFDLDVSAMKALFMYSDQDLTVETNDGAVADDTISLAADVPLVWHADDYHDNPFSVDITSLFLTNSSGATANFYVEVLYDATP